MVESEKGEKTVKYIICSDIHGSRNALVGLEEIKKRENARLIICAGDFCPHGDMEALATDFLTVMGNCDRYYSYERLVPRTTARPAFDGRNVVVTHGDRYSWQDFELSAGDVFISGHTHVPLLEKTRTGIILFNPGSASRPRSAAGATYGMMDDDGITLLAFPSSRVLAKLSFQP